MAKELEKPCGAEHFSFEEAVTHTYMSLVGGDKAQLPEPFWGTRGGNIGNIGKVIGWKSADGKKRWRLDYDPAKGVHINEEDFTMTPPKKICHFVKISEALARTYINKWTSRYDKPQYVIDAEEELLRQVREGYR
ncbi:MAG TPA: hypothetical protein VIL74_22395 [Pyrinomonadaceae bacterium]|jgi:hypothetical protein